MGQHNEMINEERIEIALINSDYATDYPYSPDTPEEHIEDETNNAQADPLEEHIEDETNNTWADPANIEANFDPIDVEVVDLLKEHIEDETNNALADPAIVEANFDPIDVEVVDPLEEHIEDETNNAQADPAIVGANFDQIDVEVVDQIIDTQDNQVDVMDDESEFENIILASVNVCCICRQTAPIFCFLPCGHLNICTECKNHYCQQNNTCPMCRTPYTSVDRIFY
ncbi:E3 ubiquitin ligase Rnf157-like [Leptopilina heterotoma]|uniref:E3 ubiquitin ligase Rnf157-like n=1 Tax=Leptopilina heterotoma TaxID=63436 RepID=UPI001CA88A6A|nr:E3 ubiquitin ligase Rnf157-like [Leptopilina heterotoma]